MNFIKLIFIIFIINSLNGQAISTPKTIKPLIQVDNVNSESRVSFIGLEGEAIFAGMGEKFQIWEPKTYETELQFLQDDFSKLTGKANPFYLIDNIVEK